MFRTGRLVGFVLLVAAFVTGISSALCERVDYNDVNPTLARELRGGQVNCGADPVTVCTGDQNDTCSDICVLCNCGSYTCSNNCREVDGYQMGSTYQLWTNYSNHCETGYRETCTYEIGGLLVGYCACEWPNTPSICTPAIWVTYPCGG
jgi:hypothetical protein